VAPEDLPPCSLPGCSTVSPVGGPNAGPGHLIPTVRTVGFLPAQSAAAPALWLIGWTPSTTVRHPTHQAATHDRPWPNRVILRNISGMGDIESTWLPFNLQSLASVRFPTSCVVPAPSERLLTTDSCSTATSHCPPRTRLLTRSGVVYRETRVSAESMPALAPLHSVTFPRLSMGLVLRRR
jgi:hypothetical protein